MTNQNDGQVDQWILVRKNTYMSVYYIVYYALHLYFRDF